MTIAQIQNETIYALPHLYVSGLSISPASTTLLAVSPGAARDSTNSIDMVVGLQNYFGIDRSTYNVFRSDHYFKKYNY